MKAMAGDGSMAEPTRTERGTAQDRYEQERDSEAESRTERPTFPLPSHVGIHKHSGNDHDQNRRGGAKNPDPGLDLVHPADEFLLLLSHVRFGLIQEQLVVLMHM